MAVVSCKRRDNKRGNETDSTITLNDEYIILVDSTDDEPSTIYSSSHEDIPKVGDPHPVDPNVTVKTRRVRPIGNADATNRLYYIMEVTYDNNSSSQDPGGGGGGGDQINVLEVTIGAWWEDFIQEYDVGREAQDGPEKRRLENTAKDPIKYEGRRPQPLITISAQTQDPGLGGFVHALGTVNSDRVNWLGMEFLQDQLMFDSYNATSVGNNTWREDFVFKGKYIVSPKSYGDGQREAGWQPFFLNAGVWQWIEKDGEDQYSPIYPKDKNGQKNSTKPVSEPWPLDINGVAIPRQDIEEKKVFLNFQVFPRTNFAQSFKFDFASVVNDKLKVEFGL